MMVFGLSRMAMVGRNEAADHHLAPFCTKSLATSAMRRMFSVTSVPEKPRVVVDAGAHVVAIEHHHITTSLMQRARSNAIAVAFLLPLLNWSSTPPPGLCWPKSALRCAGGDALQDGCGSSSHFFEREGSPLTVFARPLRAEAIFLQPHEGDRVAQ